MKRAFDLNAQFAIVLSAPDGDKTVQLRFPTDEEYDVHQRTLRVVDTTTSGGVSRNRILYQKEADAVMFAAIKAADTPDNIDADEINSVLEALMSVTMTGTERDGANYRVNCHIPVGGIDAEHVLRVATEGERRRFRRSFSDSISRGAQTEYRSNLSVAADFYRDHLVSVTGYTGDAVPLAHKLAVVMEVLRVSQAKGAADDRPR